MRQVHRRVRVEHDDARAGEEVAQEQRDDAAAAADVEDRELVLGDLRGIRIFNQTSMCAY